MEPDDVLTRLIEQFEHAAWQFEGADLQACEGCLRKTLTEHRLDPAAVIEGRRGETLVLAMQKHFFFDETYDQFVADYQVQIWSWLMQEANDYHLAWDLTQDLLLRCWRGRLDTYSPAKGNLEPYLRTMARNRHLEWRRLRKNRPPAQLPQNLPQPKVPTTGLEEEEARQLLAQRVPGALVQLPEGLRQVLQLRQEGRSHQEIAGLLGITRRASEIRLYHARQRLAEILGLKLPPTKRGRPRKDAPPHPPTA